MRRNVGSSIALSFLVVALAAVALYPADGPPPPDLGLAGPAPGPEPKPEPRPAPPRPLPEAARPPRRPDSPFAEVGPGESLADVAARVYGSADAAERLWRVNLDQLDTPDAPLRPGMMLRTP